MTCPKLLFSKLQAFLLLFLLSLALSVSLSIASYASDNESHETLQAAQSEISESAQLYTESESGQEYLQDQEFVQDEENESEPIPDSESEINSILQEPQESGQTFGQYESYSDYIQETVYNDTDSEILQTIKSIEYQLKIIAGAMVLIIIIWFIWLTIYKPIKMFLKF